MLTEKQYTFLMGLVFQQLRFIFKLQPEDLLEANVALFKQNATEPDVEYREIKDEILRRDQRVLMALRGLGQDKATYMAAEKV